MPDRVLKCDKCGGKSFTEHTLEECSQKGVMVRDTGDGLELDYDYADTIENCGCTSKQLEMVCEKCGAEYIFTCFGKFERLNNRCADDQPLAERTAS